MSAYVTVEALLWIQALQTILIVPVTIYLTAKLGTRLGKQAWGEAAVDFIKGRSGKQFVTGIVSWIKTNPEAQAIKMTVVSDIKTELEAIKPQLVNSVITEFTDAENIALLLERVRNDPQATEMAGSLIGGFIESLKMSIQGQLGVEMKDAQGQLIAASETDISRYLDRARAHMKPSSMWILDLVEFVSASKGVAGALKSGDMQTVGLVTR